jgi:phenylpropionate dioxygenase-like ring-hydroxylating dioxygenase large terminal subunit
LEADFRAEPGRSIGRFPQYLRVLQRVDLARQRRRNMPRIKCGYHEWEYDKDRIVCRIPGREYFKPKKRKDCVLDRVRAEVLGRLIFVSLDGSAPPLQDFLEAEMRERLCNAFSSNVGPFR